MADGIRVGDKTPVMSSRSCRISSQNPKARPNFYRKAIRMGWSEAACRIPSWAYVYAMKFVGSSSIHGRKLETQFGKTADYARAEGERSELVQVVGGMRI